VDERTEGLGERIISFVQRAESKIIGKFWNFPYWRKEIMKIAITIDSFLRF